MIERFGVFLRCESGGTAIEYAVIAAGVAAAIAAMVFNIGTQVQGSYQEVLDGYEALGE